MNLLENIVPDKYLPSSFKTNQRWKDFYSCIGYIFDILRSENNSQNPDGYSIYDLEKLMDFNSVPLRFSKEFSQTVGCVGFQQIFTDEEFIRKQLGNEAFWMKFRSTERSIEGSMRANGFEVSVYNLFTPNYEDYNTYQRYKPNDHRFKIGYNYSDSSLISGTSFLNYSCSDITSAVIGTLRSSWTRAIVLGTELETFDIVAGVNDKFKIDVNNADMCVITLAAGIGLTAASVASDMQTKFDAFYGSGVVLVEDASGYIRISSLAYGLTSEIDIQPIANSCYSELGFTEGVVNGILNSWTYTFYGWDGSSWRSVGYIKDDPGLDGNVFHDGDEFISTKMKIVISITAGTCTIQEGDTLTLQTDVSNPFVIPLIGLVFVSGTVELYVGFVNQNLGKVYPYENFESRGSYAIHTGLIMDPFTIDGGSNQLKINVNDLGEKTVTLNNVSGVSASVVASDIQSKVNAAYNEFVLEAFSVPVSENYECGNIIGATIVTPRAIVPNEWTYTFYGWNGSSWVSMGWIKDSVGGNIFNDGASFASSKMKIEVTVNSGVCSVQAGDLLRIITDVSNPFEIVLPEITLYSGSITLYINKIDQGHGETTLIENTSVIRLRAIKSIELITIANSCYSVLGFVVGEYLGVPFLYSDSFLYSEGSFITPHFDLDIELIKLYKNNILFRNSMYLAIKQIIDNYVKSIAEYPHYYTNLTAECEE